MTFHLPEPGLFKKQNPPHEKHENLTVDGEGREKDRMLCRAGYDAEWGYRDR
jgi:hypothetical protein